TNFVKAWNRARGTVPGWPQVLLHIADRRDRYVLPINVFPPSLRTEIEEWLRSASTFSLKQRRAPLKHRTVDGIAFCSGTSPPQPYMPGFRLNRSAAFKVSSNPKSSNGRWNGSLRGSMGGRRHSCGTSPALPARSLDNLPIGRMPPGARMRNEIIG